MITAIWMSVALAQAPSDVIYGRYTVARLTEGGETEDYHDKMERAGRALDEDCITRATDYDFGPAPAEGTTSYHPATVSVVLQQECKRGGLGVYAAELSVQVVATWANTPDGALALTIPKIDAVAGYTRLREPEDGDMRTPPHWLAPEQHIKQEAVTYTVEVDKPRYKQLPVMRFVLGDTTLHLEPDDGRGPFAQ